MCVRLVVGWIAKWDTLDFPCGPKISPSRARVSPHVCFLSLFPDLRTISDLVAFFFQCVEVLFNIELC